MKKALWIDPLPVTGDHCDHCGKRATCYDTREIDEEELVMCRDCAMSYDDEELALN